MLADHLEDLLEVFVPRNGRPPIDESFRLRDQFAALWILSATSGSASRLEREMSGREFPRRKDGFGGFSQPHALSRAARGDGMIPSCVVARAREMLPGFAQVFDDVIWEVLSLPASLATSTGHPRAMYDNGWVRAAGLSSGRLARCWNDDGTIKSFSSELIRRAASADGLSVLALLIEACRHSALRHDRAMARIYCEDFLDRLRAATAESARHPMISDQVALRGILEPLAALINRRGGFFRVREGKLVLGPSLPPIRILW